MKIKQDDSKRLKVKLKKLPVQVRRKIKVNGLSAYKSWRKERLTTCTGNKDGAASSTSPSPVAPQFNDEVMSNFPTGKQEPLDMITCKHCKKNVLKRTAKEHVSGCLKSKQEKARKKKEAREAAQRAKERAEKGDDEEDDEEDVRDGKGEDAYVDLALS